MIASIDKNGDNRGVVPLAALLRKPHLPYDGFSPLNEDATS